MRQSFFFFLGVLLMIPLFTIAQNNMVQAKWGTSSSNLTYEGSLEDAFSSAKTDSSITYISLQKSISNYGYYIFSSNQHITLDLNGYDISLGNGLIFSGKNTIITIADSNPNNAYNGGKIYTGTNVGTDALKVLSGAVVNITAGQITGRNAIYIDSVSCVYVYGGTIIGGWASEYGSSVENDGTLYVYGGDFRGGAAYESSIRMASPSSHTIISGGTFQKAKYGTVDYCLGKLDLSQYVSTEKISIYNGTKDRLIPNVETIILPENNCFYDDDNEAVYELLPFTKATYDVAPSTKYSITYTNNEETDIVYSYGKHCLKECFFEAPEGRIFRSWLIEGVEYKPEQIIRISSDVVATTLWQDYISQVVIEMEDSRKDGWQGNKIIVKKNDEDFAIATISFGAYDKLTFDYDSTCQYTFYWGGYDDEYANECSFKIMIEGQVLFSKNNCREYDKGDLIFTIEAKPKNDSNEEGSYNANKYLLTFKIGEEVVASDSIEYGANIEAPTAPEKEGHTFNGWADVPETMPAKDVVVNGSYSVNKYLLTFKIGEEVVASDSIEYGANIEAPTAPEKEGHTFNGWADVPETMPAKDVVVNGSYSVNKYLLTFKIGEEVVASDSIEYGVNIETPTAPEKEGHTFNGWADVPETMPAKDVVVNGSYNVNIYKVYYYVGDELVHTDEVAYGAEIPTYEYSPTGSDKFLGWEGEKYETMPAKDITYRANIESGILNIDGGITQMKVYDLGGRKIDNIKRLKSGVYIINGKRVVVK